MKMFKALVAAVVLSASVAPFAHAAAAGAAEDTAVTVGGNLDQTTDVKGAVLALTTGNGDVSSNIGSIIGSDVGGNLKQDTTVGGAVLALATGDGNVQSNIGMISKGKVGGNLTQKTNVKGAVLTLSTGKGDACNSIGTIGKAC